MLRFDYDLARDGLLEELKMVRGLKMAGEVMTVVAPFQAAINEATTNPPGAAPRQQPRQDRKKAAEAAKDAEQKEKEEAAEVEAYVAGRKKELTRRFAMLAEKQLDLEDAERNYREIPR